MLQDAALLELDLLLAALAEDLVLKDATPYNVQWRGAKPVFIDVGSFEALAPGEPWAGYRQFCTLFLFPLLVQAWRGVPYAPLLRGSLEGISPAEARALLRGSLRRRGALTHVVLHARLERRYGSRAEVRGELRRAGFHKGLIEANARGLRKLVGRLRWEPEASPWLEYGATTSYSEADAAAKEAFVRAVAGERRRGLLWDLGCNDGRYTRVAAEHADYAVALDADAGVIERLYRELRAEGNQRILPLVANLADPPPALGWRALERRPLWDRGSPDLALALALVHHLAIGANIPLASVVDWLRSLGGELVVEFPTRADPMVERPLAPKKPDFTATTSATSSSASCATRSPCGAPRSSPTARGCSTTAPLEAVRARLRAVGACRRRAALRPARQEPRVLSLSTRKPVAKPVAGFPVLIPGTHLALLQSFLTEALRTLVRQAYGEPIGLLLARSFPWSSYARKRAGGGRDGRFRPLSSALRLRPADSIRSEPDLWLRFGLSDGGGVVGVRLLLFFVVHPACFTI
jgi:SAM-dependent methyltransferase